MTSVRILMLAVLLLGSVSAAPADDVLALLQTRVEETIESDGEVEPSRDDAEFGPEDDSYTADGEGNTARDDDYDDNGATDLLESTDTGMVRLLDFTKAELVVNNLGGEGPDLDAAEEMRFQNLVVGQAVDLVVTAEPGYKTHNSERNGILGGNGQINLKSGTSVSLIFKFVEEGTDTPYKMKKFYMTFSDIDERHGGKEVESIKVSGFDTYYTNDDLTVINNDNGVPTFQSSDYGSYEDNDFSPDSPLPVQLSHAVTYLFTDKASFNAVFTIDTNGRKINKGRNVLFSGISQLVFCKEESTYLNFSRAEVTVNNLGGKGPSQGPDEIRYTNIGTHEGQDLDLVVKSDDAYGYLPWNSTQNGKFGEFGQVNLFCGATKKDSAMHATYTIVRGGTNDPVVLNAFALAFFDFDTGHSEQQREYIEMKPNGVGFEGGTGYSSYIVTPSTEIKITDKPKDDHGLKRFAATKHGTVSDNPKYPMNLAREAADKTVVFTFRKTSTVSLYMAITPSGYNTGRNFMFSGQDMYLMCD